MTMTSPGLSVFFRVTIDAEFDLGFWNSVTGIGMSLETPVRPDVAVTFLQTHLPAHVVYSKITLKRPCTGSSDDVRAWISAYHLVPIPTVGEIACVDQTGKDIASWNMIGVSPVSWKGPDFDAAANLSIPNETLEIAHMGFI
jgi:phage tail-like protein